jgi:hypothetical protein
VHHIGVADNFSALRRRPAHERIRQREHDRILEDTYNQLPHHRGTPADKPARNILLHLLLRLQLAIKHSLLLFYYNFTIDHWPRYSSFFMHGVAFSFGLTCVVTNIFQCWPIRAMWIKAITGHCIDMMAFHLFNSSFMIATDVVLYAMPVVFTWNMQLQRTQKVCLNLLFALGWLVLAASGARVHALWSQKQRPDFTYAVIMTWGVVDNHVAIIVACAPSMKVLLIHAFPSLSMCFPKWCREMSPRRMLCSGAVRCVWMSRRIWIRPRKRHWRGQRGRDSTARRAQ